MNSNGTAQTDKKKQKRKAEVDSVLIRLSRNRRDLGGPSDAGAPLLAGTSCISERHFTLNQGKTNDNFLRPPPRAVLTAKGQHHHHQTCKNQKVKEGSRYDIQQVAHSAGKRFCF